VVFRAISPWPIWLPLSLLAWRSGNPAGRQVRSEIVWGRRRAVCAYGVFTGTHTGEGGPCAPTGTRLKGSDYVYVMEFDGDKIRHMKKIWHAGWAMKELGWA